MDSLADYGVATDKIIPLVNRVCKKNRMIDLDDARKALGCLDLQYIRNDFRTAIEALNYGQPLALTAPGSALRGDFQTLAGKVSERHRSYVTTSE